MLDRHQFLILTAEPLYQTPRIRGGMGLGLEAHF
jgi:hypothetical protein